MRHFLWKHDWLLWLSRSLRILMLTWPHDRWLGHHGFVLHDLAWHFFKVALAHPISLHQFLPVRELSLSESLIAFHKLWHFPRWCINWQAECLFLGWSLHILCCSSKSINFNIWAHIASLVFLFPISKLFFGFRFYTLFSCWTFAHNSSYMLLKFT